MKYVLWLVAILMFYGCKQGNDKSTAVTTVSFSQEGEAGLVLEYMQAWAAMGKFNGVVYLERNGEVLVHEAINTGKYDVPTLRVGTESEFDLRSVAKLFAKAVLLELAEEGRLKLDDPVGNYVEGLPWGGQVTIRHLMEHTSGLPRELKGAGANAIQLSRGEVLDLISSEKLEFEPGMDTLYSNPGYQLLYYVIGKMEDTSFPAVLRERYFTPLGMNHSGGHFYDQDRAPEAYAFGHFLRKDTLVALTDMDREDMKMGHLYATAADLGKFMRHLSEEKVYRDLIQEGVISHAGGSRGKRAWVYAAPERDLVMVFLSNIDMLPFEEITSDLVRITKGEEVEIPEPVFRKTAEIDPGILEKYKGTYDFVDAGHLILEFRVEEDSLVAYQEGNLAGVLKPESDSVFFWDPESRESILFENDADGSMKAWMDFQGVRWEGQRIKDQRTKNKE